MNNFLIDNISNDSNNSIKLLSTIHNSWRQRSMVGKETPDYLNYNVDKPDFIEELLPFSEHYIFNELDCSEKSKILSCGWLVYNEKTVCIESDIITPSCNDILNHKIPGLSSPIIHKLVCETLVDEAYHILLVKNANLICQYKRDLKNIDFGEFSLADNLKREQQKHPEQWKKRLIQLAASIVSEIFVSDYLEQLSSNNTIQPFNQATVAAHRNDELAHSKIFTEITKQMIVKLDATQKEFLVRMLAQSVLWFANKDFDLWSRILVQLKIRKNKELINDCREDNEVALDKIDCSDLIDLCKSVGFFDQAWAIQIFSDLNIDVE